MRKYCVLLAGFLCLFTASSANSTGIPVVDSALATLGIQQQVNQVREILNQVEQMQRQAQQIRNEISMIANQVQNLQRLPGSIMNDIVGSGDKIRGVLNAASRLGFEMNTSQAQWDNIYNQAVQLGNTQDAIRTRLGWLLVRQEAEQTTLKTTNIANDLAQKYQQLQTLLTFSFTGKGNLDALQISHQIQSAQADIQLQKQAMDAALARTQLQAQAESMALQRAQLDLGSAATAYLNLSIPYVSHGELENYERWYRP